MTKTIEIDCAPGGIRPGDLLPGVLEGTGLEVKEPVGMFFGNWTWAYPEVPDAKWKEVQPTLQARITELYLNGVIRYGSW